MEYKFSTYVAPRIEDGRTDVPLFRIEATIDGEVVGRIVWHEVGGEVEKLWTAPKYRRQGIATDLWTLAHQQGVIAPQHSAWRTDDGDAWARSLTDDLPPRLFA